MSIVENIEEVRQRIQHACHKVGRQPEEVTLIAVSKTKPNEDIINAYKGNVRDFGENKVQELRDKLSSLNMDIKWHFIGHLQRNKVKYIVDQVTLIHSVDSHRLAEQIHEEGKKRDIKVPILIQVNVADEESKFGLHPKEVHTFINEIASFSHLQIKGLMTVAPYTTEPEENRLIFRQMKELYVDIKSKNIDNMTMEILSMGMTNDYEIAIEEGATMVRVGTGIFGKRNYKQG